LSKITQTLVNFTLVPQVTDVNEQAKIILEVKGDDGRLYDCHCKISKLTWEEKSGLAAALQRAFPWTT
jgi:hypothetical protein